MMTYYCCCCKLGNEPMPSTFKAHSSAELHAQLMHGFLSRKPESKNSIFLLTECLMAKNFPHLYLIVPPQ